MTVHAISSADLFARFRNTQVAGGIARQGITVSGHQQKFDLHPFDSTKELPIQVDEFTPRGRLTYYAFDIRWPGILQQADCHRALRGDTQG